MTGAAPLALVAAAALAAAASAARADGPRPRRLPLPALRAEPDPAGGGRIVDARGREVVLRGVNVNALAEYWRHGDFPTVFPLDPDDPARMAGIGWNAVRLLVSWSRVEPSPGFYDEAYLDEVARTVTRLAAHNLYSVVDFHQDAWGPTLAARPGEACTPPAEPAFGWDGAPGWATLDGGAPRCFTLLRELSPAVRNAWGAFWRNDAGPGGVGIRSRYVQMVAHVARRFARSSAVAGYDLMNEPNAFTPAEVAALGELTGQALAAIRAEERAHRGTAHLLFFEPSAAWSDFEAGTPPDFPRDANVVFAPHIYRGGITGGPIRRDDFERARRDAATFGGAPVYVGEWGSDPERAKNPADPYFVLHQDLQDEFRFSAALWTWRESCGDPHKAGDVRAGRVPYVWGAFDVDCTTNTVVGVRQALVDQLSRGWVRSAPGRLDSVRWDGAAGVLEASGTGAPRRATLVAFWPARRHGAAPQVTASGLGRVKVVAGHGGGAYLVARARGGAWTLRAAGE